MQRIKQYINTFPFALYLPIVYLFVYRWNSFFVTLSPLYALAAIVVVLACIGLTHLIIRQKKGSHKAFFLALSIAEICLIHFEYLWQNIFEKLPPVLWHFKYFFIAILLLTTAFYFFFKRFSDFTANLFSIANVVMLLLVTTEIISLCFKAVTARTDIRNATKVKSNISSGTHPDIYVLLFDEYAGSASLQKNWHFQNPLDTSLRAAGFKVLATPQTTDSMTIMSVGTILNMKQFIETGRYSYGNNLLRLKKPLVFQLLEANGFKCYNYSFFNIDGQPRLKKQYFLPEDNLSLLTYGTVISILQQYLMSQQTPYYYDDYNKLVAESLLNTANSDTAGSKFIYAHFLMPHFPYTRNADGSRRAPTAFWRKGNDQQMMASYLEYLKYCNSFIIQSVTKLKTAPAGPNGKIILVISDHGDRSMDDKTAWHNNYAAFFFPDQDYQHIPDTLKTPDLMRVVIDKYLPGSR